MKSLAGTIWGTYGCEDSDYSTFTKPYEYMNSNEYSAIFNETQNRGMFSFGSPIFDTSGDSSVRPLLQMGADFQLIPPDYLIQLIESLR